MKLDEGRANTPPDPLFNINANRWSAHAPGTTYFLPVNDLTFMSYCEYLFDRYGRFPVYLTPYRTVLGFQACHLDAEFYDLFYRPEALSATQRKGIPKWRE